MECRNCGSPIFEGDKFCFKCGIPVVELTGTAAETSDSIADGAGDGSVKAANSKTVESATVKKAVDKCNIPLSIPEEKPPKFKARSRGRYIASEPDKSKRWGSKVVLGILGVVIVILTANSAKLVNSYYKNFSTPEEYYRWVETKAIQKNAKAFAEYYANHFMEYLHRYDRHTSGEMRVELGDAVKEMMELADLQSWFEEGTFTFESNRKDSVTQDIIGLEIGGEKLFRMEALMDLKDEAVYLGFPGLTKTYLAVDTEEKGFVTGFQHVSGMEPEEYLRSLELLEVLYRECPDKSQMEALANRYLELLLNSIENVKMRTGKTVRVGNITQACTTLEIYLDKADIRNMLTELLKELQKDSEVEELLFQVFELAEKLDLDGGYYWDADEFYQSFQDNIDKILDDIEYYVTYYNELDMTVFVDDKGQIIGRTIEFPNSWDEVSFSYINPHQGGRFGYKGSIRVNGQEVSVTGSGIDFISKIKGNFTIKCEGYGIINVEVKNFDMKSLRKGYINGCFTVTAAPGSGRAWYSENVYSYLSDLELIIDISMNRSSEKLKMELRQNKELWGALTFSARSANGKKISVPSTRSAIFVDSEQDFEDWWNTMEWDELINKMHKAGLLSNAIDAVVEFSEMDVDEVLDELTELMWYCGVWH